MFIILFCFEKNNFYGLKKCSKKRLHYIPRKPIQNYTTILQKKSYMYCLLYDVIFCCCLPENFITVPTLDDVPGVPEKKEALVL